MTIAITARFQLPVGAMAEFLPLTENVIEASRNEPGCELYAFSRDCADPDVVWINEQWRTEAALEAHLKAAHVVRFMQDISSINFVSVDVRKYDVRAVHALVPDSL